PNAHLEVTPEFLEAAIVQLHSEGYEFVRLDEIPARLTSPGARPFAAFTLDDGYYNNAEHALPVFERHRVPFTIFITRGFAERTHSLWWETLGELLPRQEHIDFNFGKGVERIELSSSPGVQAAFHRFAGYVWEKDEAEAVAAIDALAREHGIDPLDLTRRLVMGREDLLALNKHPLATLGAHTVSHRAVSRLTDKDAHLELHESAAWLEQLTGTRPASFAFPYGMRNAVSARDMKIAKDLGFPVAVTTQPGTLSDASLDNLTGLPRISLNGYFQQAKYVSALASGIPFALMSR
ncbi:MAG TPA: polysaccharide deacetylase family protein, partial [Pseudorhizobium sp.]|nr:polysaccharide deacetylase family protein [Pseudorhizobium sp.]